MRFYWVHFRPNGLVKPDWFRPNGFVQAPTKMLGKERPAVLEHDAVRKASASEHARSAALHIQVVRCKLLEAQILPRGQAGMSGFGAVWPLILWISVGFRPPGAVATDIRADSTLIRR